MAKYLAPVIDRVPFIKRKSSTTRVPYIKRVSIVKRKPISNVELKFSSCDLCNNIQACNHSDFCDPYTSRQDNEELYRLIRITEETDDTDWEESIINQIEYVRSQGCYIRLITDIALPKAVLSKLAYSPYNIIQFNINVLEPEDKAKRSSLIYADTCGLYVAVLLYPIIPAVTHTYDLIEFLNSMRHSCNVVCFKMIELPLDYPENCGYYNINGYALDSKYMTKKDDLMVCNEYFRKNFCTIMLRYLTPYKINCTLCNDKGCY